MGRPTHGLTTGRSVGNGSNEMTAMGSPVAERVRIIWSDILRVSPHIIRPNTSFLRLGGDSISAMQVVSRCRNEGIMVTVEDLLKTKTISEFCEHAVASVTSEAAGSSLLQDEAESDTPFALSPIQKWFMTLAPTGPNHFNQSRLVRFTERVDYGTLQNALITIIERHCMLRARFQRVGGSWQQKISSDARGSVQCRLFQSKCTMQKVTEYATDAQASLDITNGPLVAADMYQLAKGVPVLFITAHHLVIDPVSWEVVLRELEEILRTGRLAATEKPLSFRTWCRLVEEDVSSVADTYEVAPQDLDFWGITNVDNTAAQAVEQRFSLDGPTTELLMGRSNEAFNTEPLDLLLAAVAHSFNQVFCSIRSPVAIFNKGHGRETEKHKVDLSSTVGWFTSMCPVPLSDHGGDVLRSLIEVKDVRRHVPGKGLPFFKTFAQNATSAVEITFNSLGLDKPLTRPGALFNQMSWAPFHQPSDSASGVPRFSIFDVSAGVEEGVLSMGFTFNNRVKHRNLVQQWVETCSHTLRDLIQATSHQRETSLTLADLPHLRTTYDELATLLEDTLPGAGVSTSNIQDIYPCSPMQRAILVRRAMDPALYAIRYVLEVIPKSHTAVSTANLIMAWKQVVKQHPMLRTVFVFQPTLSVDGKLVSPFIQVVLKEFEPNVTVCEDAAAFPLGRPEHNIANGPAHQLVLCQQQSGKTLIQLDISHALVDGSSVNLILDNLIKAYDGVLAPEVTNQDTYGNYVDYLAQQDLDASRQFWKTSLRGVEPCHFPTLKTPTPSQTRQPNSLRFTYPNPAKLHSLCAKVETTATSVYKLAWALLLQAYTGNSTPCFGYLASGRDLPIQSIAGAVGPFINMLVSMVRLDVEDSRVQTILKSAHDDYANSLSHQLCPLADIQRSVGLAGERLFNTVMSVQRLPPRGTSTSSIELEPIVAEDPGEVSCHQRWLLLPHSFPLTSSPTYLV